MTLELDPRDQCVLIASLLAAHLRGFREATPFVGDILPVLAIIQTYLDTLRYGDRLRAIFFSLKKEAKRVLRAAEKADRSFCQGHSDETRDCPTASLVTALEDPQAPILTMTPLVTG